VIPPAARAGVAAAGVLLLLSLLLDLPAVPYDDSHDLASHAAFAYFTKHGFQFGVDLIENAGPLAFVHLNGTYSRDLTLAGVGIKTVLRLGALLPRGFARGADRMGSAAVGSALPRRRCWQAGPSAADGHQRRVSILSLPRAAFLRATTARPAIRRGDAGRTLRALALTKHTMLLPSSPRVVIATRLLARRRGAIRFGAAG
jgi:hypothetical protein